MTALVGLDYRQREYDNRNEAVHLDELAERLVLPQQYVSQPEAEAGS